MRLQLPSEVQPASTGGRLATEAQVSNYLNQGAAYVGGVEAFLRHRIPDKFFGWISYAYTHAEQRDNPDVALSTLSF